MKNKWFYCAWCLGIFFSGVNFSNNLHFLIPVNPEWTGAWWKVVAALICGIFFSLLAQKECKK